MWHRRSLLASEKRTVSAVSSPTTASSASVTERPNSSRGRSTTSHNSRNSATPAFITRSNNPYSATSKQEVNKQAKRRSRSSGKQKETSASADKRMEILPFEIDFVT